jgi:hypothetical protein
MNLRPSLATSWSNRRKPVLVSFATEETKTQKENAAFALGHLGCSSISQIGECESRVIPSLVALATEGMANQEGNAVFALDRLANGNARAQGQAFRPARARLQQRTYAGPPGDGSAPAIKASACRTRPSHIIEIPCSFKASLNAGDSRELHAATLCKYRMARCGLLIAAASRCHCNDRQRIYNNDSTMNNHNNLFLNVTCTGFS